MQANGIVTMMREYESKSHSLQYKVNYLFDTQWRLINHCHLLILL